MKSIEERRAEKAKRIAELLVEQATATANALNTELPDKERQQSALRAVMIHEMEIPLVLQTPIQTKEYPKGSMPMVGERGPEMICAHEAKPFMTKNSKVYLIPKKP